jgi:hypothetical protein
MVWPNVELGPFEHDNEPLANKVVDIGYACCSCSHFLVGGEKEDIRQFAVYIGVFLPDGR